MTIEDLREKGLIAYEYKRGSHMYHLNTPKSDEDFGGVFICPKDSIYGLRSRYLEQVSDEKSDVVFYEFGRWIELLLTSNPTALESLFAPEDCVIGKIHPAVQMVLCNKDLFLSKECFNTFYGYAVSQISKARGLNKKIVNPVEKRLDILDFCHTFKNQGSQPIKEFLAEHKLDQKYCGLVNIPNMRDTYGVYYDWAAYFKFENIDWYGGYGKFYPNEDGKGGHYEGYGVKPPFNEFITYKMASTVYGRMENKEFFGYSGIVHPDELEKSNEVRLSSIPKGEKPICFMTYNKDAYTRHCREYKEYKEWESKRNPVRYESNLGHNYDSKNVMHCMRLIRMAKELAQGKGFNLVRTWDRDYLLAIKNHEFEYDEVMDQLEKEKAEMEDAIKVCTLPDKPNYDKINELLVKCRKEIYDNKTLI